MALTKEEISILDQGIRSALSFGLGIITTCKEAIEDREKWTNEHEKYIFNEVVTKGRST